MSRDGFGLLLATPAISIAALILAVVALGLTCHDLEDRCREVCALTGGTCKITHTDGGTAYVCEPRGKR